VDLRKWINGQGLGGMQALSRKSGVPYETLWRAADRRHQLRLDYAAKIIEATGGEVTLEDLILAPEERNQPTRQSADASPAASEIPVRARHDAETLPPSPLDEAPQ
jgi:hypothetical protein